MNIYLQMCSWILFWTHYFSSRIIRLFQYHKTPLCCSQLLLSCRLILTVFASHEVYILVFVLRHPLFWNKSYYLFHSLDRIARWHKQEYLIGLSKNTLWRRPWKKLNLHFNCSTTIYLFINRSLYQLKNFITWKYQKTEFFLGYY